MKIGISGFAFDKGRSGVSEYINQALLNIPPDVTDVLLFIPSYELPFLSEKIKKTGLKIQSISLPDVKIVELIFHYFIFPFYLKYFGVDCLYLPAGNRRLSYYPFGKTVTTFHDLSQYHVEGKYDHLRTFYIKFFIPFFLNRVDKIFAISNSTKDDIIKFFAIDKNKITCNLNGFEPSLKGSNPKVCKEILYVSRIENPGKNHIALLRAFDLLPEDIKTEYKLVFAGKEWSGAELVLEEISTLGLTDKVILTGFLDSKELADLYSRASLFVHPSLFEGFGLPLLEAMNNKLPLCVSDIPVFREVCGEDVTYFDPKSPEDISRKIVDSLSSSTKRIDYSERLSLFSWKDHFLKIYKSCMAPEDQK